MSRTTRPHRDLKIDVEHAARYLEQWHELNRYFVASDPALHNYGMHYLLNEMGEKLAPGTFIRWLPTVLHFLKHSTCTSVRWNAALVLGYFSSSPPVAHHILEDPKKVTFLRDVSQEKDDASMRQAITLVFLNLSASVDNSKNKLKGSVAHQMAKILQDFYWSPCTEAQVGRQGMHNIFNALVNLDPAVKTPKKTYSIRPQLFYDFETCLSSTCDEIRLQAIGYVIDELRSVNPKAQYQGIRYVAKYFPAFEALNTEGSLQLIEALVSSLNSTEPVVYNNALMLISALACEDDRALLVLNAISSNVLFLFFQSESVDSRTAAAKFLFTFYSSDKRIEQFLGKFPEVHAQLENFFLNETHPEVMANYLECIKYLLISYPRANEAFNAAEMVANKLSWLVENFGDPIQDLAIEVQEKLGLSDPSLATPSARSNA